MKRTPRLVVVGNGMAGNRTLEELLRLAPERYQITVFGAEPHGNYNRIALSPLLAGECQLDGIITHDLDWYRKHNIDLRPDCPVQAINRSRRAVLGSDGEWVRYDRLLLATGSHPVVLPLPGAELPGVVTFRTLEDVNWMLDAAQNGARHAVVIGGGLLGLEAAAALVLQGLAVTVVHRSSHLMERQLDATAGGLLAEELNGRGIALRLGADTAALEGESRVSGVRLGDGELLAADLVVMAVGVRPEIKLAQEAGLPCDRGILVNDTLQTFDPRIYAVGECTQHRGQTYGLVAPLWEQAGVCADHLAALGRWRYPGSTVSTQLKVTGIQVYSAGDFEGEDGDEIIVYQDRGAGVFKKLVLRDGCLRGVLLYGDTRDSAWYRDWLNDDTPVGDARESLVFGPAVAMAA